MTARRVDEGIAIQVRTADGGVFEGRRRGGPPTATVCGSFNRQMERVALVREQLIEYGVDVLSPLSSGVESTRGRFVRLDTDPSTEAGVTEDRHLDAIARSSFVWIVAPDGRTGCSVSMEIGYATARRIPALTADRLKDTTIKAYARRVPSLRQAVAKATVNEKMTTPTLLLDPERAIGALRDQIAALEKVLPRKGKPMNATQSAKAREIARRIGRTIGELGRDL